MSITIKKGKLDKITLSCEVMSTDEITFEPFEVTKGLHRCVIAQNNSPTGIVVSREDVKALAEALLEWANDEK
jgi:hypothetical protein